MKFYKAIKKYLLQENHVIYDSYVVSLDTPAALKYTFRAINWSTSLLEDGKTRVYVIIIRGTFNLRSVIYKSFPQISKLDKFHMSRSTTMEANIILPISKDGIVDTDPEHAEILVSKPYARIIPGENDSGHLVDGILLSHILKKKQPYEVWNKVRKLLVVQGYYDTKLALKKLIKQMFPNDFEVFNFKLKRTNEL